MHEPTSCPTHNGYTTRLHPVDVRDSILIGIVGQFDVDSLDQQVRLRVTRHELAQRAPMAMIRAFSPFGSTRPIAVAADEAVEPLALLTPAARSNLLAACSIVVWCGHDHRDSDYTDAPVCDPAEVASTIAWFAEPTHQRSNNRDFTIAQPHPALLSKRVWPYAVCEQRREFLRAMHWWPLRGSAVVIDAGERANFDDATLIALNTAVERERRTNNVVVIANSAATSSLALHQSGDDETLHPLFVIPTHASSLEDRIAAFAGAIRITSTDPAVIAIAASYARNCNGSDVDHSTTNADIDALALQFDSVVQHAGVTPVSAVEHAALRALRAANEELTAQLVHERVVFADVVRALRNQLDALHAQQSHHDAATLRRVAQRVRAVVRRSSGT